jgi:hypothetical protein
MRGHVLFNFFEALSVEFTACAVKGSVLAPLAELTNSSGIIVPLGEWEKNPRLQAKTLVGLRYGALPQIEPYSL